MGWNWFYANCTWKTISKGIKLQEYIKSQVNASLSYWWECDRRIADDMNVGIRKSFKSATAKGFMIVFDIEDLM